MKDAPSKTALDVGCGGGRNSFVLAENGFSVTSIDKNPQSLSQVELLAKKYDWDITPVHGDLETLSFSETYDFVFSTVVLQFLSKEGARRVVSQMQEATKLGGYNLIIVPISSEDWPCPLNFPGTFQSGELQKLYQEWDIQEYNEMF